jgi:glycosyltransferase involved in cell wall biosynthesis
MTILGVFLFNRIRTGGDRRCLELMEGLAERGNAVFVIMNTYLDYTPRHFTKIALSVKYRYRKLPPASFLFREAIKKNFPLVQKALTDRGVSAPDVIHVHGDTSLKSALFLQKKLRRPFFYASRCNDIDRARVLRKYAGLPLKKYLFSLLYGPVNVSREKQIARRADLVTFQNSRDRDIFCRRTGADAKKTVVIPGNIGLPRCAPEWENKNRSASLRNMVYVGSLHRDKGLFDLLAALKLLREKGRGDFHCSVLGREDNLREVQKTTAAWGLERFVTVEGYQDPFPFYAERDLLVYPSLYDAFPDTVLEALHTGCPVIASRTGGIPDILEHGELLFEIHDTAAIASKLEKCLAEPGYYQKIRELCAERAPRFRFDWAKEFEDAMAGLLSKDAQRQPGVKSP